MNGGPRLSGKPFVAAAGVLWLLLGLPPQAAFADDQGAVVTDVADQIRSQGYDCSNPTSVERIEAESVPDQPVYVLTCENATYKVHIIPDRAAIITEIK